MLGYTLTVKQPREDELQHWGVLGMKWGIRRYQNYDGSLTDAGRKHYGIHARRIEKKFAKAQKLRDEAAEKRYGAAKAHYKSNKAAKGGWFRKPNPEKASRLNDRYLNNERAAARLERRAARLEKRARKMVDNANWYFDEVRAKDVDAKTLAIGRKRALNILDDFTDEFKKKHPSSNENLQQQKQHQEDTKIANDLRDSGFTNRYPLFPNTFSKNVSIGGHDVEVSFDVNSDESEHTSDVVKNIEKSISRYNDKDVRNQLASALVSRKAMGFDGVSVKEAAKDMVPRELDIDPRGNVCNVWYEGNPEMTDGHIIEAEYQYDPKTKKQKLYYISLQG